MLKLDKSRWDSIKTSSKSTFDKSWTTGKKGFDKGWKALDKLGAPVNRLSNRLGSEAFWPMSLDKESEKAARILKAFLKEGASEGEDSIPIDEVEKKEGIPQGKQRVTKHIPPEVIANAKAIAVFTACRTGFWVGSAGGAGVLIRRLPNPTFENINLDNHHHPPAFSPTLTPIPSETELRQGSKYWSPPSGILLHTAALGFLAGVDIYDCVMVLNTEAAVEAFANPRLTLGAEISVAAGPYSLGGVLDQNIGAVSKIRNLAGSKKNNGKADADETAQPAEEEKQSVTKAGTWKTIKEQRPVWSYMKSRGLYFGLGQLDGSIVIERTDENALFYTAEGIKVKSILAGNVDTSKLSEEQWAGVKSLWDVLDSVGPGERVDEPSEPIQVATGSNRGARKVEEDDDPYGVHALEMSGMELFEAGSHKRVSSGEFDRIFPPSPNSPHSPLTPTLPARSKSLRTVSHGHWSPPHTPTDHTPHASDIDAFENVPLRNEEAVRRAEMEIKEWERLADEKKKREIDERAARMKRLSSEGILERTETGDTIFDYSKEKEKEKRRSTYS